MNDILALRQKASKEVQESIIKSHAQLVKRIAHHLLGRLPNAIQLDDLLQAGMVGLLEAIDNYDESKGASFETYASIRIRGHMLDEVRRNDWVPRSVYRNSRMIATAMREVENRLGRDARDHEVAEYLGMSLEEYHQILHDSAAGHLYGFEDVGITDDILKDRNMGNDPHTGAMQADMLNHLARIIAGLPKKERLVLSLYYEQDLNLKEIGEVLGVSESRVSQIHSQATHRLRARMEDL